MAEVWLYVDESQSPSAKAAEQGRPFRVGLLALEQPIDPGITAKAWDAFLNDPDTMGPKRDADTRARGYFHASEDSGNAHSPLCNAIREANLDGLFKDQQWRFEKSRIGDPEDRQLHELMNALAASYLTQQDYTAVHLIVAERVSFGPSQVASWPIWFCQEQLRAAVLNPNIPYRFPAITLEIAGSREPGIQVCDFVLWAVQRENFFQSRVPAEDGWFSRLALLFFLESVQARDRPLADAVFLVGKGIERPFLPKLGGGARQPEDLPAAELVTLFASVEQQVRDAAAQAESGNPRVAHLSDDLLAVVNILDSTGDSEQLKLVAQAYLMICDSLPTYDPSSAEESARATERRRCMARIAGGSPGPCTAAEWARVRTPSAP